MSIDEEYRQNEKIAKESLIDFENKYPGVTTTDNVNDIIKSLQKRKDETEINKPQS